MFKTMISGPSRRAFLAAGVSVIAFGLASPALAQAPPEPTTLAAIWDVEHVSPSQSPLLRHAELVVRLEAVREATPDLFSLEQIGESVDGRSINHLWFGDGPLRVLLWSQMHGDEATATSALLDFYEYVRRRRDEAPVRGMLEALTIHTVPMLNPDGPSGSSGGTLRGSTSTATRCGCRPPKGGRSRRCATGWTRRSASTCTTRTGGPRPGRRHVRRRFPCCRSPTTRHAA